MTLKKMSVVSEKKDPWRELSEVQKGERRSWFTGIDERTARPWYERWCGAVLRVGGC